MAWEIVDKWNSAEVSTEGWPTNMSSTNSPVHETATLNTTINATKSHEQPFGYTMVWLSGFIIFLFLVIGITLNLITVLVIVKYPCLRNLFTYFMFSLCISDIISSIISPLFWYRRTFGFDSWDIPHFLCKAYWAIDIMTSFATALHIVAFGVLRFVSIRWPFKKILKNVGIVSIFSIWILSFACGFIPFSIFFGARDRDRHSDSAESRWPVCTINSEWYDQYRLFQKIAYSLFFYTPFVLVVLISILTSTAVRRSTRSSSINKASCLRRRRRDRQAVMQLILIVTSFLLGYIPFTAYEFWSTKELATTLHIKRVDYYFGMAEYFFIRLSECLNPILYNIGSRRMRRLTREYLGNGCKKPPRSRRLSTPTGQATIRTVSGKLS